MITLDTRSHAGHRVRAGDRRGVARAGSPGAHRGHAGAVQRRHRGRPARPVTRDPTARFTERVADYAAHRPSYPPEVIGVLAREGVLRPGDVVADVGSGTGILTALLLAHGNTVHAVEPNAAMASEAAARLGGNPRFHAVAGRAEATGLPDASCDVVTAAQAFHWFDIDPTRREFRRILRPGRRRGAGLEHPAHGLTPFLREYEDAAAALRPRLQEDQRGLGGRAGDRALLRPVAVRGARGWSTGRPSGSRACAGGCCPARTRRPPAIRSTSR